MKLTEKIGSDLKEALKKKDELRSSTLRMLNAAIRNKEIEKRKKDIGLSEDEVIEVVKSEVKKRKEAIESYKKGNRDDLVEKENKELEILMKYMPKQLSEEELKAIIDKVVDKTGAKTAADTGCVIGAVMGEAKGRADGGLVSKMVKEALCVPEKK